MAIARYLAMTKDEFHHALAINFGVAWMACHFDPYGSGLTNIPKKLPPNSLLILNDSTPPSGHSAEIVVKTLQNLQKSLHCSGILLDFQRPDLSENIAIVKEIIKQKLPFCVSSHYAKEHNCPVFLPPVPLNVPLPAYIQPWKNREIWLDTAPSCGIFTVSKNGSIFQEIHDTDSPAYPLKDEQLHCSYQITETDDGFIFALKRTKQDLSELIREADDLGIRAAVGLYQELK